VCRLKYVYNSHCICDELKYIKQPQRNNLILNSQADGATSKRGYSTLVTIHDLENDLYNGLENTIELYGHIKSLRQKVLENGEIRLIDVTADEIRDMYQTTVGNHIAGIESQQRRSQTAINKACVDYVKLRSYVERNPNYMQYIIAANLCIIAYDVCIRMISTIHSSMEYLQIIADELGSPTPPICTPEVLRYIDTEHTSHWELSSESKRLFKMSLTEIQEKSSQIGTTYMELYKTIEPEFNSPTWSSLEDIKIETREE